MPIRTPSVGMLGWEAYRKAHPEPAQGLVLATAHPAKFARSGDARHRRGAAAPRPPGAAYLKRDKLSVPMSDYLRRIQTIPAGALKHDSD